MKKYICLVFAGLFLLTGCLKGGYGMNPKDENSGDKAEETTQGSGSTLKKEQVIARAAVLADGGKYPEAIGEINKYIVESGEDVELSAKKQEYENAYALDIVSKVNDFISADDFTNAQSVLTAAANLFPDNTILKEEQDNLTRQQNAKKTSDTSVQQPVQPPVQPIYHDTPYNSITYPFYGLWCGSFEYESGAQTMASQMASGGLNPQIFISTDWTNLNSKRYYVISAGVYSSESEAYSAASWVKSMGYTCYVKYSGYYKG